MNVEDFVNEAKSGNEKAFCELIHMNKDVLYKTAYTYTKNKHDSLEILDDTVYKAYISIKKLKEPQYFNTWLMRILINKCIDHLKKRKRIAVFNNIDVTENIQVTRGTEDKLDLYNAIDTLDGKFKIIIILRYFHDLTVPQIADIMNYPVGTVKTYIYKALKKLRIELEV